MLKIRPLFSQKLNQGNPAKIRSIARELRKDAYLYTRYAGEVSKDFFWMMLNAPRYGSNLRDLMRSEDGRHMYTKHKKIVLKLLSKFDKKGGIQVYDNIHKVPRKFSKENPATITFGILGPDWAGMLPATASVINEAGYNLSSSRSISITKGEHTLGFVVLVVEVTSDSEISSLEKKRNEIRKDLEIAGEEDPWIIKLQKEHTRIHKKYRDCKRILTERNRLELLDEMGRFFEDRPDTFLEARSQEDLVQQIIDNHEILEEEKNNGKEIGIAIRKLKNISTGNEITGVSIAADANKITFEGILEVLEHLFPHYHFVFDYNFTEVDSNNILYHIEFTKSDGSVLTEAEGKQLQNHLEMLVKERARVWTGIEPYYRIIGNGLREEFFRTGISQILVCPLPQGNDKYRVILVVEKGKKKRQIEEVIAESEKLELISSKPPSALVRKSVHDNLLTVETYVLDIKADSSKLPTPYLICQEIIRSIGNAIPGELRDYDKTSREGIKDNLAKAERILVKNNIPENFAKNAINTSNVPDEYLFSASPKEIAQQIILGYQLFLEFQGGKQYPVNVNESGLVGIGFPYDNYDYLEKCIEKLAQYSWYMSRLDLEDTNFSMVVFKVNKMDGAELSMEELNELKETVKQ